MSDVVSSKLLGERSLGLTLAFGVHAMFVAAILGVLGTAAAWARALEPPEEVLARCREVHCFLRDQGAEARPWLIAGYAVAMIAVAAFATHGVRVGPRAALVPLSVGVLLSSAALIVFVADPVASGQRLITGALSWEFLVWGAAGIMASRSLAVAAITGLVLSAPVILVPLALDGLPFA
jgi:hypothetical protein